MHKMCIHTKLKLVISLLSFFYYEYTVKGCTVTSPLGLSNGFIRNDQITSSSYLQLGSSVYFPSQARLGIRNSWCGKGSLGDQWLQVAFERPAVVNAIATQGDPNNAANFVTKFFLEFSDDGKVFHQLNDTSGQRKEFTGNSDNNGIKFNGISNVFSTSFVRFRTINVNTPGSVCLRMELYGCQAGRDENAGPNLFPLGIENGQVVDAKISASYQLSGMEAKFARLNNAGGWCASSTVDQWLQIDLGSIFTVKAVATQGFGAKDSLEMVKSYHVSYSMDASNFKTIQDLPGREMLFSGNSESNQDPVLGMFPDPVKAKMIRIIPKTRGSQSTKYCMRIELFGHKERCYKNIAARPGNSFSASSTQSGTTATNAFLFSNTAWCANSNDANQFIKIDFGKPMEVNGIALQGHPQNSDRVETFKIKYKPSCGSEIELSTTFTAMYGSQTVTRHWFSAVFKTDFIKILPKTWNGNICLRLQILGCYDDLKRVPLGMQSGFLSNSKITASSRYANANRYNPGQARLGIQSAWCGAKEGANSLNEHHQVDFGRMIILTGIATQGDPGYAPNFVKKFYLEIGNDSTTFKPIEHCSANQSFTANVEAFAIEYNFLNTGVVTRYVRLRATELGRTDDPNRDVCARLEYYGTEIDGSPAAESKSLYALGMENKVISDAQLTASNEEVSYTAVRGRLNDTNGWCSGRSNTDDWLQITFPHYMTITAVALQGGGPYRQDHRTYKYHLQYKHSTWVKVKDSNSVDKLFIGNNDTSHDPVVDFLPTPVSAKEFRINPRVLVAGSSKFCLRAELYGYHSVCSNDLTRSPDTMITGSSHSSVDYAPVSHIYSPTTWCAKSSDSTPYLLVDLGSPTKITGFGVQGDSNNDNWPTKVKVSYGNQRCCLTEIAKEFIGNGDRNRVVRHWFSNDIVAQFFKIRIRTKNGSACMRVQILGCNAEYGRIPLGMGNGFIADNQITASSEYQDNIGWKASTGRLGVTANRWCSKTLGNHEYLQVDFKRIVSLSGIASQGDDSSATNYVKQFYLQVSFDGSNFEDVPDEFGNRKVFIGNTNNSGIVYNWLPVPTKARYVRFRASDVSGNRICARLEFYGLSHDLAAGKSLFTLGMESGVVTDSQLSDSGNFNNNPARNGRFKRPTGWCATNDDSNQWLQIDFNQPMVITAVATQGHGGPSSPDRTHEYYLQYKNGQTNVFDFVANSSSIKKLFTGNYNYRNVPVFNVLPVPVTTQFIRINPRTVGSGSAYKCLRAEVYGYHPVCNDDMTPRALMAASTHLDGNPPRNVFVDSPNTWCAKSTDGNGYIEITLKESRVISGIGIQGDSNADHWIKTFKISYAVKKNNFKELSNVFTGNKDRNSVVRNWLLPPVFAKYLRIKADTFESKLCARIQVLGCSRDYAVISSLTPTVINLRKIKIGWKIVYSASSNFTLQYRKIGVSSWNETLDTASNETTITGEKYQQYEVRLKSVKGILMLDNIVQGGTKTVKFFVKKYLSVIPTSVSARKDGPKSVSVQWQKTTSQQYLDWDIQGFSISISCTGSSETKSCSSFVPREQNVTGVLLNSTTMSDLESWTNYTIKVQVYNAADRGKYSSAITVVTGEEAPSIAPIISSISNEKTTSLEVTIKTYPKDKQNGKLLGYHVLLQCVQREDTRDCSHTRWRNITIHDVKIPFIVRSLVSWTYYEVKIQVFNGAGASPASSADYAKTKETAPSSPPSNIQATAINSSCIEISWKLLNKNDTNGIIQKYTVTLKGLSGSTEKIVNVVKNFGKVNVTGLKPFTNYSFEIAAVNSAGTGPKSKPITSTTLEAAPNKAPSIQKYTPKKFSATVEIKNIDKADENGILIGYKISYKCIDSEVTRNCSSNAEITADFSVSKTTTLELINLGSWTRYAARIRVYTKAGIGPYSLASNFDTLEEVPKTPPKSITLTATSSRSLLVKWKSPNWNDTNGIITGYSIRQKSILVGIETFLNVSASDSLSIHGLNPYTNYTVRVAAINKAGLGPYSSEINERTLEAEPAEAPKINEITTSKRIAELHIQNINKTKANGKLLGYYVGYRCIQDANTRDCPVPARTQNVTFVGYPKTVTSVSNLYTWMKYAMTIQVYNSAGASQRSTETVTTTKEDNPSAPPNNIAVEVTGSKGLKITWQTVAKNDTNGNITGYNVHLEFMRRGNLTDRQKFISATSLTFHTLFPYTMYTVTIAAKNSAGIGKYSAGTKNRTEQDAPSSPTIFKTIPKSTTEIQVKWIPPLDLNGIITKYELSYCLASNCTILSYASNQTEASLKNLETQVDYHFKVRAFTIKAGNWSKIVTQKTEVGIPTMPLQPRISQQQSTSLKLSWKAPEKPRGTIIYYMIKAEGKKAYNSSFSHVFEIQDNCSGICTSRIIKNLTPGTVYTFEVAVATSAGMGPFSAKVSNATLISEPPKPVYKVVSNFQEGGTERNLTVSPVTNLYGSITAYQIIVEKISGSGKGHMTIFPELLSKTAADAKSLKYYLAKEITPSKMPFFLRFQPGISYVKSFEDDLDTPGNYYLHFRAATQTYGKAKSNRLYGAASVYHLDRKFMKKLPEPKDKDIGPNTAKIQLTTSLPKGFTPSYYYIIAMELVNGVKQKDSSSYKQADLKKYDSTTTKPGTPYIAAVITQSELSKNTEFVLGDGKTTKRAKSRRKRQTRAVSEEYYNSPLKPSSSYSVFIRAVSTSSSHYSTPWTAELKTKVSPSIIITNGNGQDAAIGAGVSVSIIVIIIGIAFGVFFRRRRQANRKSSQSSQRLDDLEVDELKKPRTLPIPEPEIETTDVDGIPYEPINLEITPNQTVPFFAAKDIVQVVKRKSAASGAGFQEEFENLPQGQLFTWNIGGLIDNKLRNRFANIIAYDYSRVKLINSQDESDYVNASYIVDYYGVKRYIASQAPIVKTVPNFWTMVWEQELPAIVMLTNCVENNKRKSEEYWPTSGSQQHGNIKVTFLGAEEFPEYCISTLELEMEKSTRTCKHFHYLTWPDHGVPRYPTAILSFRRRLRQAFPFDSQNKKPIMIHCSAGVGRTGAFIAIDTLIHLIHKKRIIDVFGYVSLLRLQRPQMVQRWPQYKFIYDCLLEAAVCGVTEISTQEFRQRFNNLSNPDQKTGKDGFHREFTCLSFVAIEIEEEEFSSAKQSCIVHKNRDLTVLPKNTQRVFLPAFEFTEGCNYINAVYVDGLHEDQFIATQAPLESTIGDFWRMVVDRASSTIVSLVDENEVFPRYWPEKNQCVYDGNLKVSLQSSDSIADNVTRRRFVVTDETFNRTSNEIHHYNLSQWSDHSVPESVFSLVQLINEMEKTQRAFGGGPIIVHCSNGAGRTGSFIAAYIILERLKNEQMIDVFQVVRRIRQTRPNFVENKDQYKLLYEVAGSYLEQFSTYSNF